MIRLKATVLLLVLAVNAMAEEQQPSLELLMFLVEYTDTQGDWNAPDLLEESTDEQPQPRGDGDE